MRCTFFVHGRNVSIGFAADTVGLCFDCFVTRALTGLNASVNGRKVPFFALKFTAKRVKLAPRPVNGFLKLAETFPALYLLETRRRQLGAPHALSLQEK